jgi:phenylacetate-CoA ligase
MNFDSRPLHPAAFDAHPFAFLKDTQRNDIANIASINLLENGERVARENWQKKQLTNLLRHAHARSNFWRKRMPSRMIDHNIKDYLPIQTRDDLASQVKLEGSLLSKDSGASSLSYASTGSTGTPVSLFTCQENAYYNPCRSMAQFFINDLSLNENRVQLSPPTSLAASKKQALKVTVSDAWAGELGKIFRNGSDKRIVYGYDDDAVLAELLKNPVGYLVSPSRYVENLIGRFGAETIKRLGIKLWLHLSDYRDPEILGIMKEIGIPSLSNYSAGETGPIAFECDKHEGYFHIAHSNVIVDCDQKLTSSFNGASLGRLLITHLHSYSTPVIRYDIGDFAKLHNQCRCGHDGPTLSNIYGRGKHFLSHPNGTLLPFYVSTRLLLEVASFKECRFTQSKIDTIVLEISGRDIIPGEEEEALKKLVTKITDPAFRVEIKAVNEIDWSGNPKRLFFSNLVA